MAQIFSYDDHDTVVRKYAELVQKNNPEQYRVVTCFDEGEKAELGGVIPDIALFDPKGTEIQTVIEVETATSISNIQAESRWKPIADAAPAFQLLIPKGALAKTKRLCKKIDIKAKYQEY
ncbi:MAG: hypothetical protein P9X24_01610 [Candidatus Hatepunaea meridiana]|nr:hypothetical protein [Candidatus Hatepunaea meridiana]